MISERIKTAAAKGKISRTVERKKMSSEKNRGKEKFVPLEAFFMFRKKFQYHPEGGNLRPSTEGGEGTPGSRRGI